MRFFTQRPLNFSKLTVIVSPPPPPLPPLSTHPLLQPSSHLFGLTVSSRREASIPN